MPVFDITRLSTKGQVVIPRSVRSSLSLLPGAKLMVMSDGDNILIKPMQAPKLAAFDQLIQASREATRKAGMKRSDIAIAIRKVRHAHRD